MKKMNALLAGVMMAGTSAVATAEAYEGFVGISYQAVETYDLYFGGDRIETGDLVVRFGGKINEYFMSELRIGTTVSSEEQGDLEFKNDLYVGGLLRLQRDYGALTPYVGVSYTYIKSSFDGDSESDRDLGYAAGLDVGLGERLGLNVEYWVITGDPTNDLDRKGPSAGVFYRF